ncbi:polysaccharide deacetylase family protein [Brevibacterium casei]|uniref:polysaccharide deacetylase family protein n=1 Tax=Brevibacterium casei TaxID=33889 RepID=UPI00223B5A7B|nr:polysaccharide deacetylase family protein [Brevibacterium casei]MCT1550185.1 polysaccharide deacetylase family protein [Brevibacterium casei]MCT1560107.1 polysaccharide deacetylase family protein [Brevibacterium casei]MCT2208261.1 polysaccharide deacetylase family protein [Brevibacterium casei]
MKNAPTVLMYHGVADVDAAADPENLMVPVSAFEQQMTHLMRSGYRILSEAEYLDWLDGRPLSGRSVLVTFDDGYRSVLRNAVPILTRLGVPAICYVCPGLLGGQSRWMDQPSWHELMDADQLTELVDSGISLGVHGLDHTAMDSLGFDELATHTSAARDLLEQQVGLRARTLAYPYGYHSPTARQAVSSAGFACAFAIYDTAGRWALPRVDINSVDTHRTFGLKLRSIYPAARRTLSVAPPLRRAAHKLVGLARR